MTEPQAVYVKWVDSTTIVGWVQLGEGPTPVCLECITLGFIIYENDEAVTVAASLSFDKKGPNAAADPITIPRVAIRGLWYIEGVHD